MIETATELINSDIKSVTEPVVSEYTKASVLKTEVALEYISPSLLFMLQHLLFGNDTRRKDSSIGQRNHSGSSRQNIQRSTTPRKLAVQMHHHFRSRFLIETLCLPWSLAFHIHKCNDLKKISPPQ